MPVKTAPADLADAPAAEVVDEVGAAAAPEASEQPAVAAAEAQDLALPRDPLRLRLFDAMPHAIVAAGEEQNASRTPLPVVTLGFDEALPANLGFGLVSGRQIDYSADPGETLVHAANAGFEGGALRLGPNLPQDSSRALFFVPAAGLAKVRITGRVRLLNNPASGESSTREVLRIYQHADVLDDPAELANRSRRRARRERATRLIDPSGWDRIDHSFITRTETQTLEIQLLHRSGGSDEAVTLFDEMKIEVEPLTAADYYGSLRERYTPRDGRASATPWRLRVSLGDAKLKKPVVRDALLLPPPIKLSLPLVLPAAESRPVLTFHYGMAPDGARDVGDGVRLHLFFVEEGGEQTELAVLELDPDEVRAHRSWLQARIDLRSVAGRTGHLVFDVRDMGGEDPVIDLDPFLIATPRIEPTGIEPEAFNVLLIGVDTLRADHLSAFGYERPTTPALKALADEGVRFSGTRSQAPWTLPSFSSILTSLYPSSHGAGRGGHDEWTPIDPTTTSIAEILAERGWQTQGIVANGLISPRYGLDQGFDAYSTEWAMESATKDAPTVAQFVEEHTATPWLLFWHIMDPHLPYSTADEYREQFVEADYEGQFSRGRRPQVPFQVLDPRPGRRWFAHEGPPKPPEMTAADKRFVSDYYDAELAEMDAAVGQVLEALKKSGQWDRTIVAFVADHGEGLGDHDHYHHGYTLFDDQIHIPMILRIPGQHEGRVVTRPVAAIDLAPMILGALGIEPPEYFQGVDRLAPDAPTGDAFFVEYPTYDSSAQKAWIAGNMKYLHDPVFHTEALYDLENDPAENINIVAQHPDVVARARAELDAFRWRELQKGRFHLRVRGRKGQRLTMRFGTDDLFDANFASRPQLPETCFEMDHERSYLALDTELAEGGIEIVFWCRGGAFEVLLQLDGQDLPLGVLIGDEGEQPLESICELTRDDILECEGARLPWPKPGGALLWLEAGVAPVKPVVLRPEEIEMMEQLGYTR